MQDVQVLSVPSVKAAKTRVKREFPKGGTIYGYIGDELVYQCVIQPQSEKTLGGRSAYSDRDRNAPQGTYPKPEVFFFNPEVFDFSRSLEKPEGM